MHDFNSLTMKRLFVAIMINPDKGFSDQIHSLETVLRYERIKWVEDHNIHITLKFFGETEEKKIPGITAALRSVASASEAFSFALKSLGIFGSSYDPRVVWVGIKPYENLVSIMRMISSKLEPIGFKPDRQNLVPHLTLGRIKFLKDKKVFTQIIDQNRNISSEDISADHFILFESILKKEGPLYLALHSFHMRK